MGSMASTSGPSPRVSGGGGRIRGVPGEMLRVGKPVPGTIFDERGHVLLRAGTPLSAAQLKALKCRGLTRLFVGPDWPDAEGRSTIESARSLEAILDRAAAAKKKRYCRRHERRACRMPITVELEESHPIGSMARTMNVTTIDLSAGGMAFESEGYIHPGTGLISTFDKLAGRPRIRGVVRSCTHVGGRVHRIGVEFIFLRSSTENEGRLQTDA